jgi:endonuclease/exonuclease/phosphatase family metal-dependent hydrolase
VKLVTWNIQWGRGIDERVDLGRIVRTARELADFDVLCVQEVADNFPGLPGNDARNQFDEIARLLPGYRCVEGIAVEAAAMDGKRRRFGNAIYSRYSVMASRVHALPWPADPGKKSMPRIAVEAILKTPLGPLRLTTTHLEYYSDVQRRAQAARLREIHAEACERASVDGAALTENSPFGATPQTHSAILTGDFNFPPDHPAFDDIQGASGDGEMRYVDSWTALRPREPHAPTFCLHTTAYSKSPYCCDFLFASENLVPRLRRIEVDTVTQASDHQPVLLEIDDR